MRTVRLLIVALLVVAFPATGGAQTSSTVDRVSGATRAGTAAAISARAHPEGASTVVLARGDAYGDALASSPLAAALGAPVLLTAPDRLEEPVAQEIARLGADRVVVVGMLGDPVVEGLTRLGVAVERVADVGTAWDVAADVVRAAAAVGDPTTALLVEGASEDPDRGWPDALTASAWAAQERWPVLMTRQGELPPATRVVLQELVDGGLQRVVVVGGDVAVSDAVAGEVDDLVGEVQRVAGSDRYETAVAVARRALGGPTGAGRLIVASGRAWPDAVVAGPAASSLGATLVLVDPTSLAASPATREFIDAQASTAPSILLAGGTAAISEGVAAELRGESPPTAAATTLPDRPDAPAAARNDAPDPSTARPWSDPATWGGQVPREGDVVTIPPGTAVRLDVDPPAMAGLRIRGTLVVPDRPVTIEVGHVLVEGLLQVGTTSSPIASHVEFVIAPDDDEDLRGAGPGAFLVDGGTLEMHGALDGPTWTRLEQTAPVGASELRLLDATGWRPGDRIVIASTDLDPGEAEVRTISAIEGRTVVLDQPLAHDHHGASATYGGREVAQRAEVGSLSRRIVVRSTQEAAAAGSGGHVIVYQGSVAHVSGVELAGLGRAGEMARYPFHFHMMGSAQGSYLRDSAIHGSANRCVTVHGTQWAEVSNNVAFDAQGHCYFLEDGVEYGTTLFCNLGIGTSRPDQEDRLLPSDATPATFWISNPAVDVEQNAAGGSEGVGFWYDLPEAPTGLNEGVELPVRRLPFGSFEANVAHSNAQTSLESGSGLLVEDYEPPSEAVFEGFTAFKNQGAGAWVEGATVAYAAFAENGIGFLGDPGVLRDSVVVGTAGNRGDGRPYEMIGVAPYHRGGHIQDVHFENFISDPSDGGGPRTAVRQLAKQYVYETSFQGLSFRQARPLTVMAPGDDARVAFLRDSDGSLTGSPAVVVSELAHLRDSRCAVIDGAGAYACPASWERAWLVVSDLGDGSDLGDVRFARADGGGSVTARADAPALRGADVVRGQRWVVESPRTPSRQVSVVVGGDGVGHVDVTIPWPYHDAHVYRGWGRRVEMPLGGSLASLDQGMAFHDREAGLLHVRHDLEEWAQLELCAIEYCGAAGPS